MKVLLATPELDPLTGGTPLGAVARAVADELADLPEVEIAFALPAGGGLLERLAPGTEVRTISLGTAGGEAGARAHQVELPEGPSLFLLETPGMVEGFNAPGGDPAALAALWGALLLELTRRIRPSLHLAHAFGWESALLPLLLREASPPLATVFSNPAGREGGPPLGAVLGAAASCGLAPGLEAAVAGERYRPVAEAAASAAHAVDALEDFGDPAPAAAPSGEVDPLREKARARLLDAHGLADERRPLVLVPARDPAILLPMLPRLAGTGAAILLVTPAAPAAIEAGILAAGRAHPGSFARLQAAPGQAVADPAADLCGAADLLLLLPSVSTETGDWALAAHALARGCVPILPRRSLPPGGDPASAAPFFAYRDESPEAILAILKEAVALHRDPVAWRARTAAQPPEPRPESRARRLALLYRRAVKPLLDFS